MPLFYHRRSAALRDTLVYQLADGSYATGLTQAAFTLRLSKNGATQATTGITITEISAVNNPGWYAVQVDGTTGFVAADGFYTLTIERTSDPTAAWQLDVVVNNDGVPSASGVMFTATTGNGRVTDGINPVQGATVILSQSGAAVATFTTDASGIWGPVYLIADGSYLVSVQKSGYTSASGTVTVSGGATIVAGPGADLVVSGTAQNQLLASELWAYFTRMARDVAGTKADTERKQGVQDALDMVAKEGQWNWLLRRGYLQLNGAVTVTATLTDGSAAVVQAGTWPTWAASGKVLVSGQVIDVSTRDSATQLSLETAWASATGSYSVTLFQDEYALPDNMLWMHQIIPFQRWGWGAQPTSPEQFYIAQSAVVYGQQMPSCYAVHAGKIMFYPYPNTDAQLAYTYYARPAPLLTGADAADWDPSQIEVLRRAIDVQVAFRYGSFAGGTPDQAMSRYKEAVARARSSDRAPTQVGNVLEDVDPFALRLNRADWHRRG